MTGVFRSGKRFRPVRGLQRRRAHAGQGAVEEITGLSVEIRIGWNSQMALDREKSAEPVWGWGINMKRFAASVIAGAFLFTTFVVGDAVAHTFVAETSLSISKAPTTATAPGTKVYIFGRLMSPRAACRSNMWVKLMRIRPGQDLVLESDRTDSDGNYRFVRYPRRDLTVYTRFSGTFDSSSGHFHRCLSSRSRLRFINTE
jgi:hypothetical protein